MNTELEEQEDELLALQSIFASDEFVRNESKSAGEIRVSVELPAGFTVVLKEGKRRRQYEISFLPPLRLNFELPEDYPSSSPPSFTLTCSWLTHTQLSALTVQLTDIYQATRGTVVLFSWVQFLKEDALTFLNIHNVLELPSDEHSARYDGQDTHNAALSESNSQHSQNNLTSLHCDVSQNGLDSEHNRDYQKTLSSENRFKNISHDSNQSAQASDVSEAEQASQTQSDKVDREDVLLSSSSSGELDQNGQGAACLPAPTKESLQNKDREVSGPTHSQTLMSQILIFNAGQKEKEFASTVFECGVCFMSLLGSECVQLSQCSHVFCQACLAEFCKVQITEGNVRGVTCPQADCISTPTPAQVKTLVGDKLFSRYDRLLLQSTLDCMPDVVYCPRHSCGSVVIREKSSNAALCSVCGFAFCVTCGKTYHGQEDCAKKKIQSEKDVQEFFSNLPVTYEGKKALMDDYASGSKKRKRLLEKRYGRGLMLFTEEELLSMNWMTNNSKSCPHCFVNIEKDGGCNIMTCRCCSRRFCWSCLRRIEVSDLKSKPCSFCIYYPL